MRQRSLSTFLAGLILLTTLPLVLTAGWLAVDDVLDKQAEMRRQAATIAENLATAIDYHLDARIGALHLLAASPLADDPQRWPDLYAQALGYKERFGSHVILAGLGDPMPMLFNTRTPLGAVLPPLPRFQGQAAAPTARATRRPAVSDTFLGPVAKEPLVAIAVPGIRAGTVTHILLTTIATRQFQERLDQVVFPNTWALSLVDGRGDVIARRAPSSFDARRDVERTGRFTARLTTSPWSVVLEIPRTVYWAPIATTGIGLALALTVAIAASLLGGTMAGRCLTRQITALTRANGTGHSSITIREIAAVQQSLTQQAEHLRLSESRFDATFEQAAVGIALVTLEGHWLRVNRQFCTILGYSREELLALGIPQLTHPDDLEADLLAKRRLIDGEDGHYSLEKRYLRKDGTPIWVNLCVTLIRNTEGIPDCYVAVVEDIQARKEAEAALLASEQRYRQLVENANSAIIHWSGEGYITFINTFAQRLFGWSEEEIVGQHIGVLVPKEDTNGADLTDMVRGIIAAPERYQHNTNENICRDGRRVWMAWTNQAIRDEQGRVTGILTVGNDITELKRTQTLLHEGEERIRFALETSQIGAWDLDLVHHTAYRSPRHDQIFGYAALLPEWTYELFLDHVHPDDRQHVDAAFQEAVATGGNWSFECRIWRRDGQLRWIWAAGRHAGGEDGAGCRMAGIVQDITERKEVEEELRRRNEELERFNHASVGRELRMIELKRQINELSCQLDNPPPFDLSFTESP